jgi:RHS repeat-associated protein
MKVCPGNQTINSLLGEKLGETLVGDPVCVITGAVIDAEIDFRLPQASVPITWWRAYHSSRAKFAGPVGHGFHHSFDVALIADLDGLRYIDVRGNTIEFPPLKTVGASVVRQAHRLIRITAAAYRVESVKGDGFAFDFARSSASPCRPYVCYGTNGNELALFYDPSGQWLREISLDAVYLVAISYDRIGTEVRVARVELVERQSATRHVLCAYAYDSLGRLIAVQDGYRAALRYTYDDQHRVVCKTDRLGYSFYYAYDAQGRCTATRGEDGIEDLALEYRNADFLTVVRRADGATRNYFYTPAGQVSQRIEPDGGAYVFPAEKNGRILGEVDPLGNLTGYRFDAFGTVTHAVDPFGYVRNFPADATPHPLALAEATTSMQWDLGHWVNAPIKRIGASEVPTIWPQAVVQAIARDHEVAGRPREEHDFQGLLVRQVDAQGRTRRFGYDANGNPRWRQDFDGQVERFHYASWNQLASESDALGATTRYSYSQNDRIAAVVDPGGTETKYTYDPCDRLREVLRHGKVRERYAYDLAGNLLAVYGGDGQPRVERTIGPRNLLKRRVLQSGEVYDYDYDAFSRLVLADGPSGTCEFAYTSLAMRCADLRDGQGVRHRFVGDELAETTLFERFVIRYQRVDDSDLKIVEPTGSIVTLRDHKWGLIERIDACATTELSQYNLEGTCLLRAAFSRGRSHGDWIRRYTYSGEGDLLVCEDSQRGAMRYALDGAHRLAAQQGPDGKKERFIYDLAGNLLASPHVQATYDQGNRLYQANGEFYTHNERDHISSRQGDKERIAYSYNARDHLVRVQSPSLDYRASFDGLGRRTEKKCDGELTRFYWDGDRLAAEILPDASVRIYVYADHYSRVPLSFIDYASLDAPPESGVRYMVLSNHLGCPEKILDAAGRVVWHAEIAAYGWANILVGEDFHQPLRWPGHYFDRELGLHDNRYRTYDPRLGRYLQSDPIGLEGGLNLYAYTNNPLREVDLRGLTKKPCPDNVIDCPHRTDGDGEGVPKRQIGPDGQPEPVDSRYGLTKAQREHFRQMRRDANGDPVKLEQMRYERTQARRRNKGQPEFESIDAWRNDGRVSGANRNRDRGTEVSGNTVNGVGNHYDTPMASGDSMPDGHGGTTKYEVDVENVPPHGDTVRTRPDGISVDNNGQPDPSGVVMDNKHFMGTGNQEYGDTPQLRAQRQLAESNGGTHVVSLSSDNPQLNANPPRPRPSSELGSSTSHVVYSDPNTGQVTHTWNPDTGSWDPV